MEMRWWEQDGLDFEGMHMTAWEEEQTEGAEKTDRKETVTYNQLIGEDTVVTITLGAEYNDPLSYAPRLEPDHATMSTLGDHRGH